MSRTHKQITGYTTDAGAEVSVTQTFTANTEIAFDATVPTATVNLLFTVGFPADDLISCVLSSDQALTLNVNSTGSPAPAIALAAGVPLVWSNTSLYACPFTTSPVTGIYLNNASGSSAVIKFRFLVDSD